MKSISLVTLLIPYVLMAQSGWRAPASAQNSELKLWQDTNPKPTKPEKKTILSLAECHKKVLNVDVSDSNQMWRRDDAIGSCLQPAIAMSGSTANDYRTCMNIAKLGWRQKGFFEGICKDNLSYSKCEEDASKVIGEKAKLTAQYKCMVRHMGSLPTKKCQSIHPGILAQIKAKGLTPGKEDAKILRNDFCDLSDKPFVNPVSEPTSAEQR